jgi:hypothetical protein
MLAKDELLDALETLGELLNGRGHRFEIVVIGGGALLLRDAIARPTQDLDVVARIEGARWKKAQPLPDALVEAIRDVAAALDLPRVPRDDKDWLNAGPSFLFELGLPDYFAFPGCIFCPSCLE